MKLLNNNILQNFNKNNDSSINECGITISFYKYFNIFDIVSFKNYLYNFLSSLNILGRIYISNEGINAQITIPKKKIYILKKKLVDVSEHLKNIHFNESIEKNFFNPFKKLQIKIKKKIVADGIEDENFNFNNVGNYLNAKQVNNMFLDKKNNIFVDMRNLYEYKIGRFSSSLNIPKNTFREQIKLLVEYLAPYKNKNIVMYCTGGIRCEKSTSWIKYHGFKNVYHIKNGIMGYVNEARKKKLPIYFKGKMFVFDSRMSEVVTNDILSNCHTCQCSCDNYLNCHYQKCHLLFIQCQICIKKFHSCCSKECKDNLKKK